MKRLLIPTSIRTQRTINRFKKFVGPPDKNGCWPWIGAKKNGMYGTFGVQLQSMYYTSALAHRVSYVLFIGELPIDGDLHHECGNTACVNPNHLKRLSRKDHSSLSGNPWGMNARKTECPLGHALSGENLKLDKTPDGKVRRRCRKCANAAVLRCMKKRRETKWQTNLKSASQKRLL